MRYLFLIFVNLFFAFGDIRAADKEIKFPLTAVREFEDNQIAAEKKWSNQSVNIHGHVVAVVRDGKSVILKTTRAYFRFDADQEDALVHLKNGDTAIVNGAIQGIQSVKTDSVIFNVLTVHKCKLIKHEPKK
jgi:hypothetical protein